MEKSRNIRGPEKNLPGRTLYEKKVAKVKSRDDWTARRLSDSKKEKKGRVL